MHMHGYSYHIMLYAELQINNHLSNTIPVNLTIESKLFVITKQVQNHKINIVYFVVSTLSC